MTGITVIPGATALHVFAALCFFITAASAGACREKALRRITAGAGCLSLSVHLLVMIAVIRRLPLYGGYETVTVVLWTGGMLFLFSPRMFDHRKNQILFGVVLGLMSLWPVLAGLKVNHDFFMYASYWVQGFFFFKLLAAGVMLRVGLAVAASLRNGRVVFEKRLFMAGAVLFLCSELSGSIWCLLGWGDSWHWSGNFFQSTIVFFIMMLNLHIPSSSHMRRQWVTWLHLLSPFFIIGFLLW